MQRARVHVVVVVVVRGGDQLAGADACPGNSAVPMVKPPKKFSWDERGNLDENTALRFRSRAENYPCPQSDLAPHHSVIECQPST